MATVPNRARHQAGTRHPISNPYIVGLPLKGAAESLFVGRDDVFTWLAENVHGSARPNALLLYGRRRIGKTSTLYQLVDGARGTKLRANSRRPIYPIYVDLQRLAGRPTDEWLRRLALGLYQRASPFLGQADSPRADVYGGSAFTVLEDCLDRLQDSMHVNGCLLLAIDEVEQIRASIEARSLSPEVLAFLRAQIQHRERIIFLLSGSASLLDLFWAPLVNLAARRELGPLDRDQTLRLVRRPVSRRLKYAGDAAEAIWLRSMGHPFYVQTICHRLVSHANGRQSRRDITAGDVEMVVRELESENFFDPNTALDQPDRLTDESLKDSGSGMP